MGKTVRCTTKNLEFTKVMQVEESVLLSQNDEGYVSVPSLRARH